LLTADLVRVRRRDGALHLAPLDGRPRARAHELAETLLAIVHASIGRTREEVEAALAEVEAAPAERLLTDGLRKLIDDGCEFDAGSALDPEALRRAVFARASAARREGAFDRAALCAAAAAEHGLSVDELERALYADLRGAQVLRAAPPLAPAALVEAWARGRAQAVLLRAVKVVAEVRCGSAGAYRALFHKLKFLRLLHTIRARPDGDGYAIEVDGPFSLFESVTKYGLQLALLLPALEACDEWRLEADVRWGKAREPLAFRVRGGRDGAAPKRARMPRLADEVEALLRALRALESAWRVAPTPTILELPGAGLCVPDLVFQRDDGARVYLEVMGYWSRAAVWRRVELVQAGLPERILFAVSERLRVSEAALDGELPGALYIYKGTMSAKAILERVERLARG
jgi:predicted nuclease of restriction endonuclease-like RecB superfamily